MPERGRLLALVPDEPAVVEARALLLSCEAVLWFEEGRSGFVAGEPGDDVVAVVGEVRSEWIDEAVRRMKPGGVVLAYPKNLDEVRAALPGWKVERALIFDGAGVRNVNDAAVRWLEPGEVERIEDAGLRDEMTHALRWTQVAAVWLDGVPVAFCYAAWMTERRWDISIDTVEAYRRMGYAERAVRWTIGQMRTRGKEPVWGALESNVASRGLAGKLGFRPAGELWVLRRGGS
ncbi:MAG: GNAT family N-acetyltransferase [Verrucomicrobiota bacterium]